ncbi:MAG: YceI family protein [Nocardioides sp.]
MRWRTPRAIATGPARSTNVFYDFSGSRSGDPARLTCSRLSTACWPSSVIRAADRGHLRQLIASGEVTVLERWRHSPKRPSPQASFVGGITTWHGTRGIATGELTLHGVTRPITFEAGFEGYVRDPRAVIAWSSRRMTGSIVRTSGSPGRIAGIG